MAKCKNYTTHNRSWKWHQETQVTEVWVSEMDWPKVIEKHALCQETQQEGAKENGGQQHQSNQGLSRGHQGPEHQGLQGQAPQAQDPQSSIQCAGHKMATKRPGPRIMKPDSKVARITDPKVTKSASRVSKSDPKTIKSSPKATKSEDKVAKSDLKAAKSDPKAVKSDSKATKPSDSKAAKPTDPKPEESKIKDAGAKAASPKPSK